MPSPTIGQNLRRWRLARGLINQKQTADRIGVHQSRLSEWEKDRAIPEVLTLLKIAAIYDVSLDALVAGVHPAYDARQDAQHDTRHLTRDYEIDSALLALVSEKRVAARALAFLRFPDSLQEWLLRIPRVLGALHRAAGTPTVPHLPEAEPEPLALPPPTRAPKRRRKR